MSTDVRTRLSGAIEDEFKAFKTSRKLTNSEALQALISRGLEGVSRDEIIPLLEKDYTNSVQILMITQRLLASIDPEELEKAKKDARNYLMKGGN